jgi:hypothetical protein
MTDIFVFGSNLAGRHGAGAAWDAWKYHGAVYGKGYGPQGESYAIPTKSERLEVLDLPTIAAFVEDFKRYARAHPELTFNVTRIGCGLAGYKDAEIAPFFNGSPGNVVFFDANWNKLAGRSLEECFKCNGITWHDEGCIECKSLKTKPRSQE